jgi:hypothetical protein
MGAQGIKIKKEIEISKPSHVSGWGQAKAGTGL